MDTSAQPSNGTEHENGNNPESGGPRPDYRRKLASNAPRPVDLDIEDMLLDSTDATKLLDEATAADECHIFVHKAS